MRIDVDEHLFHRRLIGRVGGDDFADAGEQGLDTFRQRLLVVRLDAAAGDIDELVAVLLDDAKAGALQAGVDAVDEDAPCVGPQAMRAVDSGVR